MKYLIWSHEHGAWWGPHHLGYPRDVNQAGRYDLDEAIKICRRANQFLPPGQLNEVFVPESCVTANKKTLDDAVALVDDALNLPFSSEKSEWDKWCASWAPRAEALLAYVRR